MSLGTLLVGPFGVAREGALEGQRGRKWLVSLRVARVAAPRGLAGIRFVTADDGTAVGDGDLLVATLAFEPCNHLPWDSRRLKAALREGGLQVDAWQELLAVGVDEPDDYDGAVSGAQRRDPEALGWRVPHSDGLREVQVWGGTSSAAEDVRHLAEGGRHGGSYVDRKAGSRRRRSLRQQPMVFLSHRAHLADVGLAPEATTATAALRHSLSWLLDASDSRGQPIDGPFVEPSFDVYWFSRSRAALPRAESRAGLLDDAQRIAQLVEDLLGPTWDRGLFGAERDADRWRWVRRDAKCWEPVLVPLVDLATTAPENPQDEQTEAWRFASRWVRSAEVQDSIAVFRELPTTYWVPSPFFFDAGGEDAPPEPSASRSAGGQADGRTSHNFFRVELPLLDPAAPVLAWIRANGGLLSVRDGVGWLGITGYAESRSQVRETLLEFERRTGVWIWWPELQESGAWFPVITVTEVGPGASDPWAPRFEANARDAAERLGPAAVESADRKAAFLSALESWPGPVAKLADRMGVPRSTARGWARAFRSGSRSRPGVRHWEMLARSLMAAEPGISGREVHRLLVEALGDAAPSSSTVGRAVKRWRAVSADDDA